jgi:hypothetical protein
MKVTKVGRDLGRKEGGRERRKKINTQNPFRSAIMEGGRMLTID